MKKIVLVMFALSALSMTACDNGSTGGGGGSDTPKKQDSRSMPMFADKKATIKSEDTFTTAQWNKICSDIAAKFKAGYDAGNAEYKGYYEQAFTNSITIIVENNPQGYNNYKYTRSNKTLNVKANGGAAALDANDIVSAILGAQDILNANALPACDSLKRLGRA